ncbi:OLC1v1014239C1 [Oldenlandia corymbosa var. corymbosa]|uniref:OLC1v1014239C1 n=1 Tax=Oldenlandia corymbosa var. corymbosa TaxID=529605 RepID=A0AAV1E0K5_OLDCO|nr:OLC1v1014239C1 [Oldenlandia corymbosa var. corymbosa]
MKLSESDKTSSILILFFICLLIIAIPVVQCSRKDPINSSVVLSLPLYPYSSILKQHRHRNYTQLKQSRIAADAARINSISSRIRYKGHNHNDPFHQQAKTSPRTAVFPNAYQTYLVNIGVGQPEKQIFLVMDTGSSITWLQCQPCDPCFFQFGPVFDPSNSSTFSLLPCSSPQCSSIPNEEKLCSGESCGYTIAYGDGSDQSSGIYATETLTFDDSPVKGIAIGCGHTSLTPPNGFSSAAGIIGLGLEPQSFPSQINASSFSYCLVAMDSGKFSPLEFNSAPPIDSVFTPMVTNPKTATQFYYLGLAGITVGGTLLPIPATLFDFHDDGTGGVILDSGSSLTYFPLDVYQPLSDAITQRAPPGSYLDPSDPTCYEITSDDSLEKFPEVGFVFAGNNGNKTLTFGPRNYMMKPDDPGSKLYCWCFELSPFGDSDTQTIIGMRQQQGIRITFDLVNKQIGFSLNKC